MRPASKVLQLHRAAALSGLALLCSAPALADTIDIDGVAFNELSINNFTLGGTAVPLGGTVTVGTAVVSLSQHGDLTITGHGAIKFGGILSLPAGAALTLRHQATSTCRTARSPCRAQAIHRAGCL